VPFRFPRDALRSIHGLAALNAPDPNSPVAAAARQACANTTPAPDSPTPHAAADHSRFVQRVRRRYGDELAPARGPARLRDHHGGHRGLQAGGATVMSALRVTRQLVLERLAVLDIEHGADQADITSR
jgi:glutamate-ammonia-ligase adenylyltransferase